MLKWTAISPYIYNMVIASVPLILLWICLPKIFASKPLRLLNNKMAMQNKSHVLLIIFTIIYLSIILTYIFLYARQGIRCIGDLLMNNYITNELVYIRSEVDRSKFFVPVSGSKEGYPKRKFFIIIFADNERNSLFYTTFPHVMEEGKRYTVLYARRSEVILSILSADGQEMLMLN